MKPAFKPVSDCKGYTVRRVKEDGTRVQSLTPNANGHTIMSHQEANQLIEELKISRPAEKFAIL